jgi:hypothetical protein
MWQPTYLEYNIEMSVFAESFFLLPKLISLVEQKETLEVWKHIFWMLYHYVKVLQKKGQWLLKYSWVNYVQV